jgi:two-component system, OmpR family, sensor histidine kinase CpxA
MKSLFLRIFLSFWAALLLFIVLSILVAIAVNPGRGIESQEPEILAEAVNAYQSGGERAAHDYLEGFWRKEEIRAFVFDPTGKELSGHQHIPPWIEGSRRGAPFNRSWWDNLMPDRIKRQALTLDGKRYTLVMEMPPSPRILLGPHALLLITIAILSSGLVCYLLARSMTSPITRLRQAAQSLAAGDLTARTGAPSRGPSGEIVELMRDFDRMAERLEGLVDSQSRLLKDVSHELRSPLARLSVALGLARQRSTPEIEGQLDRIELEADRLNQLIQRLLTIARLESGADGIRKSSLSLRELVEQVAYDAEYESAGRGCRVTVNGQTPSEEPVNADIMHREAVNGDGVNGEQRGEDEFLVDADPDLLRSAVENVVRNATRYTAPGSTVNARLERQTTASGEEMIVRVSDSGPGVPEAALAKIFEPFYRLDDARNRQTGGAGLGLSIADRAIRLHGGHITASNRKEGGLEVEIRIPANSGVAPENGHGGSSGEPGFALPARS